jgi:hypothetical protein
MAADSVKTTWKYSTGSRSALACLQPAVCGTGLALRAMFRTANVTGPRSSPLCKHTAAALASFDGVNNLYVRVDRKVGVVSNVPCAAQTARGSSPSGPCIHAYWPGSQSIALDRTRQGRPRVRPVGSRFFEQQADGLRRNRMQQFSAIERCDRRFAVRAARSKFGCS